MEMIKDNMTAVETLIIDWLKSDNENTTYLANQICILLDVTDRFCKECGCAKKLQGKGIIEAICTCR